MAKQFAEQPMPLDDADIESNEEIFSTMDSMGTKPEDLPDPNDAAAYKTWKGQKQSK